MKTRMAMGLGLAVALLAFNGCGADDKKPLGPNDQVPTTDGPDDPTTGQPTPAPEGPSVTADSALEDLGKWVAQDPQLKHGWRTRAISIEPSDQYVTAGAYSLKMNFDQLGLEETNGDDTIKGEAAFSFTPAEGDLSAQYQTLSMTVSSPFAGPIQLSLGIDVQGKGWKEIQPLEGSTLAFAERKTLKFNVAPIVALGAIERITIKLVNAGADLLTGALYVDDLKLSEIPAVEPPDSPWEDPDRWVAQTPAHDPSWKTRASGISKDTEQRSAGAYSLKMSFDKLGLAEAGIKSEAAFSYKGLQPLDLGAFTVLKIDLIYPSEKPISLSIGFQVGPNWDWKEVTPVEGGTLLALAAWQTLTFDLSTLEGREMVQQMNFKLDTQAATEADAVTGAILVDNVRFE